MLYSGGALAEKREIKRVYLGLGSNLGDRVENLRSCIRILTSCKSVRLSEVSGVYQTDPVGYKRQPQFLNAVVRIETALTPKDLLSLVQKIEKTLGRKRTIRWGPRTIDVDILLYGGEEIDEPGLMIPHPRIYDRRFVLLPLKEIDPDLTFPDGRHIDEVLDALGKQQFVERLDGLSLV